MAGELIVLTFEDGETGTTLSTNYRYIKTLVDMTIVGISASPNVDDTGLTVDVNDDGSSAVDGVDASDADVPGVWKSTHFGGSNAPVFVAAGSKLSLDANNAAANTMILVHVYAIAGSLS